jgi:DNA-binding transcriptional ArsR family regulator
MTVDAVTFAKALADDTRQRIMKMLCCEWLSVGDIVDGLAATGDSVSQPTVSHHLSILKDAALVSRRREGKQVFYTLNQKQVTMCCGMLMTRFAPDNQMTVEVAARPTGER